MTTNSILSLFEGLTREQAQQLTDRIVPTLTAIRAEIVKPKQQGENEMLDEFALTEDERAELSTAYDGILSRRQVAAQEQLARDLDGEEKAELAQVRRGDFQAISTIQAKYRHLRREITNPTPAPVAPADPPEIVQAREAGTLQQVYDQRVQELRGRGNGSQHALIELKKEFRHYGLEVW